MSIFDTFLNWGVFVDTLPLLLSGLWITVGLGVAAILLGLAGGLFLVLLRLYGGVALRPVAILYIDVFRSIPVLVLLIVIYYALPFVGVRLSPFGAATTALSLVSAAYSAEILRAGIEAVPRGQFEAADALGFGALRRMSDIVLPQADKARYPAADVERHQRPEGHGAGLGRGHAGPLETGHPGPGSRGQPDTIDRRRSDLHRHSPALRAFCRSLRGTPRAARAMTNIMSQASRRRAARVMSELLRTRSQCATRAKTEHVARSLKLRAMTAWEGGV